MLAPLEAWERLSAIIVHLAPGKKDRLKLDESSIAVAASVGYCAEHGEVTAIRRGKRLVCWCGDSVILKAEERRIAEREALGSMSDDPTWRC
jgi:hypothetical protein